MDAVSGMQGAINRALHSTVDLRQSRHLHRGDTYAIICHGT